MAIKVHEFKNCLDPTDIVVLWYDDVVFPSCIGFTSAPLTTEFNNKCYTDTCVPSTAPPVGNATIIHTSCDQCFDSVYTGVVTYTLFDEVVTCPNVSYKFQDCEDETIFYYTTTQPKYLEVPVEIGEVVQVYLNTYLKCVTFLGAVNSSADSTLGTVISILPDCSSC